MGADFEKLDATFKISASVAVMVLAISSLSIIALVIARKIHKTKAHKAKVAELAEKTYRKPDTMLVSVNGNPYDTTVNHVIGDKRLMAELDDAVAKIRQQHKNSGKEHPQTTSSNPLPSSNPV